MISIFDFHHTEWDFLFTFQLLSFDVNLSQIYRSIAKSEDRLKLWLTVNSRSDVISFLKSRVIFRLNSNKPLRQKRVQWHIVKGGVSNAYSTLKYSKENLRVVLTCSCPSPTSLPQYSVPTRSPAVITEFCAVFNRASDAIVSHSHAWK